MAKKRQPIEGAIPSLETPWDDGTNAYTTEQVETFLKKELSDRPIKSINLNGEPVQVGADGKAEIYVDLTEPDSSIDINSTRPVQNQAVAQKFEQIEQGIVTGIDAEVSEDNTAVTISILGKGGAVIDDCEIPIASGSGSGDETETKKVTVSAVVSDTVVKEGSQATLTYTYDTVYVGGDNSGESTMESGKVTVEVRRGIVTAMSSTYEAQPGIPATVDITSALAAGYNDIVVTAKMYDADAMRWRQKSRTVKIYVSALKLSSSFDLGSVVKGGGLSGTVKIPYTISGSGGKTVTCYLDGAVSATQSQSQSGTRSGEFSVNLTGLNPGSRHHVQLRAEVTIDGVSLTSDTIHIDLLVSGGSSKWVGVMYSRPDGSVIESVSGIPTLTAVQYDPINIQYAAYNPDSTTSQIEVRSGSSILATVACERIAYTHTARYKAEGSAVIYFAFSGVTSGQGVRRIDVEVSPSPIDVSIAIGSLEAELTAESRNNAEADPAQWGAEQGITTKFSGVDWETSGWTGEALRLINGASATVGIQPFLQECKTSGMTLELAIKVDNPVDDEAAVISSLLDGKGLKITPSKIAYLTGATVEYTNEDEELVTREVQLKSEYINGKEMIVHLVVHPTSEEPIMELYVDGDRVAADEYASQYEFALGSETTSPGITFDSAGADVEVKSIRFYRRALTDDEIVDNVIAQQSSASEMMTMHENNDVLAEGLDSSGRSMVSLSKISGKGKGTLRIVRTKKLDDVFESNDKSLDFIADVYYEPSLEAAAQGAKAFTLYCCYIRIQGTSSTKYPAKNIRIYLNKGEYEGGKTPLLVIDGVTITGKNDMKYSLRDGVPAQTVLCAKKDFSDSSMSLNTGGAKLFNTVMQRLDLLTPPQRYQKEHGGEITVRAAIDGLPIDVFVAASVDGDYEYVGQYNLNNEKSKSDAIFGMTGVSGLAEEIGDSYCPIALESLNNGRDLCLFRCPGEVSTLLDDEFDKSFEFNYPEDTYWGQTKLDEAGKGTLATERQRTAISSLVAWIKACVPAGADPNDISTFVSSKFVSEASAHFDVAYMLTYYLWTDYFLAVDQRAKNILWRTWDGVIWYPTYYDGDTQMGKSNDSYMSYGYATGRSTWDSRLEKYAFEGYTSWLWCLVLANMQQQLRTAAANLRKELTVDRVMAMYRDEQMGNWSERVFNKSGYLAYIKPQVHTVYGRKWPYIYALQGRNLPHREYMVVNRFAILDAKYGCGDYTSDRIQLYVGQEAGDTTPITISPTEEYCFGYGTNSGSVPSIEYLSDVIDKGQSVTMNITGQRQVNDPMNIYGASRILRLGLGAVNGHLRNAFELSACTSMQELDLSVGTGQSANNSSFYMALEGCRQLRTINLKGQTNACTSGGGSKTLDLSSQSRLESLDCRGVDAYSLTLAAGCPISELYTPVTLQTLRLDHLPNINATNLHLTGGWDTVTSLIIKGCPGIDSRSMVEQWLSGKAATELSNYQLELDPIEWGSVTASLVEKLASMKSGSLRGVIDMGSSAMSGELKAKCVARWGDIDSESAPLRIIYTKKYITAVEVSGPKQITRAGEYQFSLKTTPANANDITSIVWRAYGEGVEIDSNGLLTVRSYAIGTEDGGAPTAQVSAVVTNEDGDTFTSPAMEVRLYEKSCAVGDLLYADGTTSSLDERDTSRTVVGVVCWIDPDNKSNRLACALSDVTIGPLLGNTDTFVWGLSTAKPSGVTLASGRNAYNVPEVPNFNVSVTQTLTASAIQTYGTDTSIGYRGFKMSTDNIGHLNVGDYAPYGLLDTLYIVAHRDAVLSDANVGMAPVEPNAGESRMRALDRVVAAATVSNASAPLYYFMAASAANAYSPLVPPSEGLSDKLSEGRWFLPSSGELAWLYGLLFLDMAGGADMLAAVSAGILSNLKSSNGYWASTEGNFNGDMGSNLPALQVTSPNYGGNGKSRNNAFYVRPMVAF